MRVSEKTCWKTIQSTYFLQSEIAEYSWVFLSRLKEQNKPNHSIKVNCLLIIRPEAAKHCQNKEPVQLGLPQISSSRSECSFATIFLLFLLLLKITHFVAFLCSQFVKVFNMLSLAFYCGRFYPLYPVARQKVQSYFKPKIDFNSKSSSWWQNVCLSMWII